MSPKSPPPPQPESLDFPFKYADRDLVLRFSTRASSRLKDHWGLVTDPVGTENRKTGDAKLMERLNFMELEDVPILLWAAMRSNHPEVTVEDVEEMVDRCGVTPALQEVIGKCVQAAHPPPDAKKKPTAKTTPSR